MQCFYPAGKGHYIVTEDRRLIVYEKGCEGDHVVIHKGGYSHIHHLSSTTSSTVAQNDTPWRWPATELIEKGLRADADQIRMASAFVGLMQELDKNGKKEDEPENED